MNAALRPLPALLQLQRSGLIRSEYRKQVLTRAQIERCSAGNLESAGLVVSWYVSQTMLELEEALRQILAEIPAADPETVLLNDSSGRYLAQAITAPIDLPPFDNSSMDGYAVRSADISGASGSRPVRLRVTGRIAAGDSGAGKVTEGTCIRLFTGSPLPQGADAVVMQEDTQVDEDDPAFVQVTDSAKPLENVRLRGEDVKKGAPVLSAGELVNATRSCLLAALGVHQVQAGRRPVVGLIATGSELREPGQTLEEGQIYESNRVGLASLVEKAGGIPKIFALVPDSPALTRLALEEGFKNCDIVITSGGVSVGEMDFVKQALEEVGGKLQFWRVAVKPGRPFAFGRVGTRILFGLPGNPVSALVTFLLLVRPALIRWQGGREISLPRHGAVLGEALSNRGNRRHFVRVKVDSSGQAFQAGVQGSHVLSSLAAANGLVDVPAETVLGAGTTVQVMHWD